MIIRMTLLASTLVIGACGSPTENSSEAGSKNDAVPIEKIEAPTESSLDFVSKHLWSVWGLSCQGSNSYKGTYDKKRGLVIYRNGEFLQDDKQPNKRFNIVENSDGSFSYHLFTYTADNPNILVNETIEKIKVYKNEVLNIERKTIILNSTAMVDSSIERADPSLNPEHYEINQTVANERVCGRISAHNSQQGDRGEAESQDAMSSIITGSPGKQSKNIELPVTKENCEKIDGAASGDRESIAREYNILMQSISFIGSRWDTTYLYGGECLMIFDTAIGPKRCAITKILSDDGGKTAFASIDPIGNGFAGLCRIRD